MLLRYEITPQEHLEMLKHVQFSSWKRLIRGILGLVGIGLAVLACWYVGPLPSMPLVALFTVFTAGQVFLPAITHRRIYFRNPQLFGVRSVTFDDEGMKSESETGRGERKWNAFDKFEETKNLFLIFLSRDAAVIVPKRAFSAKDEIAEFKTLLRSRVGRNKNSL